MGSKEILVEKTSCLHACSQQEVAGYRDFGLSNPVAIIPNGIGISWLQSEGSGSAFRKEFEIPESKRILLYLSRITPIKGLPMLMDAIGSIRQQFSDWALVIAGADEFGHLQDVQKAVSDFGLQNTVIFTGMLKDQLKRDAFAAADVFVLPTLREAAPVVVLEALGTGVPVITTKGAPWQDLVTHNCGWWTDISADALAFALLEASQKSPAELNAMGERGRTMVSVHYSWEKAARMTIELYEWLLERRERPAFVVTD
jgi:glycosyltransferase involved in cell wall biosynthesis